MRVANTRTSLLEHAAQDAENTLLGRATDEGVALEPLAPLSGAQEHDDHEYEPPVPAKVFTDGSQNHNNPLSLWAMEKTGILPGNHPLEFAATATLFLLLRFLRFLLLAIALIRSRVHDVPITPEHGGGQFVRSMLERGRQAVPNLPADLFQRGCRIPNGLRQGRLLAGLELLEKLSTFFGHGFSFH
jgi:hypothetical protein